uniref:exodeoxyribonuclease III n=1 Tax=Rousettus aegyptiacus TaxID=9407 RepID=A0A7J8GAY2_ROUAE|nr:hypothetical protein HJG63_011660 [Rousettus aegyptiacus]
MDKKTRPMYMLSTRDPIQIKRHSQTESKGMEKKYFLQTEMGKKTRVAIFIADKIDFKAKAIIRDKKGHYIKIKGLINQEDIILVNIYTPNIGAPTYIKKLLTDIKGEINSNTLIVGDFNTPLTPMDRSSRQRINKETKSLKDTLEQMDLIDIFRAFYPKAAKYTFFSSAHGTFSRIDHMLGHKSSLNKFKKIEIISMVSSDHNGIKLDITSTIRKKTGKYTNTWRLNNMLLNNEWVINKIKKKSKIPRDK